MNKSAVNSTDVGPDPKRLENNTIKKTTTTKKHFSSFVTV